LLPVVVAAVLSVSACYFELAARLEKTPVEGMDGSLFRGTTFDLLYTDAGFPTLATIWRALDTGRPVPPAGARGYQRDVSLYRVEYPLIGAATANIGPCLLAVPGRTSGAGGRAVGQRGRLAERP
jgi:hypothetical protein